MAAAWAKIVVLFILISIIFLMAEWPEMNFIAHTQNRVGKAAMAWPTLCQ